MIFQSLMGLGKSRYDVPSGPPKDVFAHTHEYIYIFLNDHSHMLSIIGCHMVGFLEILKTWY